MNAVNQAIQSYTQGFNALESAHTEGGAAWLSALRREAFSRFSARGFPGAREEDWKYTSTRPLESRGFTPARPMPTAIEANALDPVLVKETPTHRLIFINGRYTQALSSDSLEISGVRITPLDHVLANGADRLRRWIAPETVWNDDPFTALNTAFLLDGVLLEIDDHVHLQQPLQLVFISTPQTQALACHPRILLSLGTGATATLIESYYGLDNAANFTNSYLQIDLGEAAQLEHLRLQRESQQGFHVGRVRISQNRNSRYLSHNLNLGGLWVRNDLRTRLEAPGATTVLNGLYAVNGRQHVDNHTRIDHLAPATGSDELYRGIINGHGRAVFNGKVVVAAHAVKTDANQTNNNLLLSRTGEIDTKPELEIYADDVKCSHGATIGQLDEQALFYLRSRGLDLETARGLLVNAFALTILDRITMPELRAYATRQVQASLPSHTAVTGLP